MDGRVFPGHKKKPTIGQTMGVNARSVCLGATALCIASSRIPHGCWLSTSPPRTSPSTQASGHGLLRSTPQLILIHRSIMTPLFCFNNCYVWIDHHEAVSHTSVASNMGPSILRRIMRTKNMLTTLSASPIQPWRTCSQTAKARWLV